MLGKHKKVFFPEETPPELIVVIDTEEEFDWDAEPDPEANTVHHMQHISKVQDIFNQYGIKPCYVIDYPIASHKESVDVLKQIYQQGQCEIGAHLHPWVNPPFKEKLIRRNMYPGNLDYDLEYQKLYELTRKISDSFGIEPKSYKAGRYGVSASTASIMGKLGYEIDLSICTGFDYRSNDGGPDFTNFDANPYYFGGEFQYLEIPLSSGFVGMAGIFSKYLYNLAGYLDFIKARGILSRLNLVDRLMLSPEGYGTDEHIKLTRFLYGQGVRTFTWNFHSPTVVPGSTMYTKTEGDVEKFLDKFKRYFDFFFTEMNGEATTPIQLKQKLEIL